MASMVHLMVHIAKMLHKQHVTILLRYVNMENKVIIYRSSAESCFYGTEYETWADFRLVGSIEKKIWADYKQILKPGFSCFRGQKKC